MTEGPSFRKVAFLDTMTLHYIRLCLEYAKENGLQFPKDEQAVSKLKAHFHNIHEKSLKKSLKTGLETIVRLSTNNVQIEYAPVSELEMLTGLAAGKARIKAAQEGIPHRMWSRFSEKKIRDRTTADDLAAIKERIDELGSMLEESGVTVTRSNSKRTNEVIELAKGIVGLIYMSPIDSIIYASAVVAGADCLVTADHYLQKTVNNIHHPQNLRYKEIRRNLGELVRKVMLEPSNEIDLPQACNVTHNGKLKGCHLCLEINADHEISSH